MQSESFFCKLGFRAWPEPQAPRGAGPPRLPARPGAPPGRTLLAQSTRHTLLHFLLQTNGLGVPNSFSNHLQSWSTATEISTRRPGVCLPGFQDGLQAGLARVLFTMFLVEEFFSCLSS